VSQRRLDKLFCQAQSQKSMKSCNYCGRENEDATTHCKECGTSFGEETIGAPVDFRRALQSPLGLAVTSGLGTFFICTGIYAIVGRVSLHIFYIHHPEFILPPNAHDFIIIYSSIWRLLMVGFAVFTFTICWLRCQKKWQAVVVAIISFGVTASLRFMPWFLYFVPALAIGFTTNSSAGYYIGSIFQIGIGAWLLGWFSQRKIQNAIQVA
jgi:hypothetical protein